MPLASVQSPEFLAPAIAESIQFAVDTAHSGTAAQEQLLDYLSERSTLLVLDNFEQLVEYAPSTVARWVRAAGRVRDARGGVEGGGAEHVAKEHCRRELRAEPSQVRLEILGRARVEIEGEAEGERLADQDAVQRPPGLELGQLQCRVFRWQSVPRDPCVDAAGIRFEPGQQRRLRGREGGEVLREVRLRGLRDARSWSSSADPVHSGSVAAAAAWRSGPCVA